MCVCLGHVGTSQKVHATHLVCEFQNRMLGTVQYLSEGGGENPEEGGGNLILCA